MSHGYDDNLPDDYGVEFSFEEQAMLDQLQSINQSISHYLLQPTTEQIQLPKPKTSKPTLPQLVEVGDTVYTTEQIAAQTAITTQLEKEESILREGVQRAREEFQRAQEAYQRAHETFTLAGEKHRPIREQLTRARGLLHMMTATEDLGDERNSTKIDRDSLSVALSFLDRDDWRVSRHWQVCRWWYLTMKKAGPHHLWRRHDHNTNGQLFIKSPLRHHFTRISVNGDTNFLKWMVKELPAVWDLNLNYGSRYQPGFDLSPLLGLTKLRELELPPHQPRTTAELDIIKRLPALEDIRHPVNASDLNQLLKAPSRVSEWKRFGSAELGHDRSVVLGYVRQLTSLEFVHFPHHVDPDGVLGELLHLKKLWICPRPGYANGPQGVPLTLLQSYGKSFHRLKELIFHVGELIRDENQTQFQVSEFFLSDAAPNLTDLHMSSVYTLSDLTCFTKLTKLQRLSFNGRLMFTAENLLKLSLLRHLAHLTFWCGVKWSAEARRKYNELEKQKPLLHSFFPALQEYNLAPHQGEGC